LITPAIEMAEAQLQIEHYWAGALRRIVKTEKIDLLIPTTDGDVREVSRIRDALR